VLCILFGPIFCLRLGFISNNRAEIIPNYSQQDATFLDLFIFTDALHVSSGSSATVEEMERSSISSTIAASSSIG